MDGQTNAGEGQLKKGMVVLLNGTISEDYGTGQTVQRTAKTILYEDTIEGPVQSVAQDGLSLVVLGQTVLINQSTIIDPTVPALSNLKPNDLVEVSGFVSGPGTVVATLIDRKIGAADYQVKGFITQHDDRSKSFTIGSLTVDYRGADIGQMPNPSGNVWNGLLVDIHGAQVSQGGQGPNGAQLTATRVKPDSLGTENVPEAEIEGIVTLLISPTEFYIGNVQVQTTSSTEFENGTAAEIVPGATAEVEGPIVNGILVAEKVEFKDSVIVESDVATLNISTNDSGTLTLNGLSGSDGGRQQRHEGRRREFPATVQRHHRLGSPQGSRPPGLKPIPSSRLNWYDRVLPLPSCCKDRLIRPRILAWRFLA